MIALDQIATVNDFICSLYHVMSCSKIETAFYESRIRVNGEKIFKKSKQASSKRTGSTVAFQLTEANMIATEN